VRLVRVAPTSLAYRLGLRDGDRITRVDGTAIRTVDDAATVYVRLLDAKGFSVEVERGADIVTLRYAIQ
jgi:C-terminal processing protease CtpA/Prc